MTPKYKLGESKEFAGATLFQIIALRTFNDVNLGDIGGWIETEANLAQEGDAWIYGDAMVYGKAHVRGDAMVYGDAQVYGDTEVYDNAQVYGYAEVYGYAQVYINAEVYGYAQVCGDAVVDSIAQVCGDAIVTKAVNTIHTTRYDVTVSDNYIKIGCENHPIIDWEAFTDDQISKMDAGALKWWRVWKPIILALTKKL